MSNKKIKILTMLVSCFLVGFLTHMLSNLYSNRTANETTLLHKKMSEADQSNGLNVQPSMEPNVDVNLTKSNEPSYGYLADLAHLQDMKGLINMEPLDYLAKRWNSRDITCDFSDYEEVEEAVDTIPVSGEFKLSKEQEQNIKEFISKMLFYSGRNEVDGFFNFLKKSGETISDYWVQWISNYLVEKMHMIKEELPADPWKLVVLYYSKRLTEKTAWKGFVQDGSEIRTQIVKDKDSAYELPGIQFQIMGRAQSGWAHLSKPPIRLEEIIKQNGKVLVADAVLFIAHNETLSEEIFPYFIRYWFDPINSIWRPLLAVGYPRHASGYHHGLVY